MARFLITEVAGRFVAGRNNNGVGSALELTEDEAKYELMLGTIIRARKEGDGPEPVVGEDATDEASGQDSVDGGVAAAEAAAAEQAAADKAAADALAAEKDAADKAEQAAAEAAAAAQKPARKGQGTAASGE